VLAAAPPAGAADSPPAAASAPDPAVAAKPDTAADAARAATNDAAAAAPSSTAPTAGVVAVAVQQPLADAAPTAVAAAPAPTGQGSESGSAASVAAQINTALVAASQAPDGTRTLQLQLHPATLGRVQISVVQDGGNAPQVTIAVEKAQTLALLTKDDGALQRALDQAGIASAGRVVTLHTGLTDGLHAPAPTVQAAVAPLRQPDSAADAGGLGAGAGSAGGGGFAQQSGRGNAIEAVGAAAAPSAAVAYAAAAAGSGIDITA
jgi:flagellar hook-length control protein FliK